MKLHTAPQQYITNVTKCPSDDWLTTSAFLTTHVWLTNYQAETFTVDFILIQSFLKFIHPN